MKSDAPSQQSLANALGESLAIWDSLVNQLEAQYGPLITEWKPSKSGFGRMCLVKRTKRTVLYLTPEDGTIRAAIVLGERAAACALASDLPQSIKALISEARPYAEGRGIRFLVHSEGEMQAVMQLVAIKLEPSR